jgi:hypothetical protein
LHRGTPVLAFVLMLVGLVWIGQGLGLLRGSSFMVDDVRWAIAGLACVAVGLVILGRRRLVGRRG